jgi:hypothetical protein
MTAGIGEHAARRFLEFFAATIRNKNRRVAYYLCRMSLLRLGRAAPHWRARRHRARSRRDLHKSAAGGGRQADVKLHLARARLVVGQFLAVNPAQPVRGPKQVVRRGKTPC